MCMERLIAQKVDELVVYYAHDQASRMEDIHEVVNEIMSKIIDMSRDEAL